MSLDDLNFYYVAGQLGMKSNGSFTKEKRHWMTFTKETALMMLGNGVKPYGATKAGTFVGTVSGKAIEHNQVQPSMKTLCYGYCINLDERGDFYADVRDPAGKTVFEIRGFEIFEDGFMRNKHDLAGLQEHLAGLGFIDTAATIYPMAQFEEKIGRLGPFLDDEVAAMGQFVAEAAQRGVLTDDDQWFGFPGKWGDGNEWIPDTGHQFDINICESAQGYYDVVGYLVENGSTNTSHWRHLGSVSLPPQSHTPAMKA